MTLQTLDFGAALPASTAVTIILPFADDHRTLRQAVQSVFRQTHSNWLLMLVNDGSTDGSDQLASRISDSRVTLLGDEERMGLPARLNQAIQEVRTPFIARMDADDMMHPDRLTQQVRVLEEYQEVDLVGTRAVAIDASGRAYGAYAEAPLPRSQSGYLRNGVFTHPTVMGRTRWFRQHPYDASLLKSQDKDLWCRSHASSCFLKLNSYLLFYRLGGTTNLAAALATCRFDRRVVRRWGPTLANRRTTVRLIAESYGKQGVHVLAHISGRRSWLEDRRVTSMTAASLRRANDVLRSIVETEVPGW